MHDTTILIHTGYHKTATSWLQTFFLNNPALGLTMLPSTSLFGRALLLPHALDFNPSLCRMLLQNELDSVDAGVMPVLSIENLSGNPHSGGYYSKEFADRLVQVFPDAKILMVIREQNSMILSTYKQYLQGGGTLSLKTYLQPPTAFDRLRIPWFDFDHFKYDRLIRYYMKLFESDRVLVLPYEQWQTQPNDCLKQVLKFCGIQVNHAEVDALPYHRRINYSLSSAALATKRQLNGWMVQRTRYNAQGRWPFRVRNASLLYAFGRLDRALPKALRRWWDGRWQALIRELVQDRYGVSNAATSQYIDVDLNQYGYEVES